MKLNFHHGGNRHEFLGSIDVSKYISKVKVSSPLLVHVGGETVWQLDGRMSNIQEDYAAGKMFDILLFHSQCFICFHTKYKLFWNYHFHYCICLLPDVVIKVGDENLLQVSGQAAFHSLCDFHGSLYQHAPKLAISQVTFVAIISN